MSLKCPIYEIAENLETAPALLPGAVPMISPDAPIESVVEAFLTSQIPNKKTEGLPAPHQRCHGDDVHRETQRPTAGPSDELPH